MATNAGNDEGHANDGNQEGGASGAPITMADLDKAIDAKLNNAIKGWGPRLTKGLATAEDINGIKAALEALKPKEGSGGPGGDGGGSSQGGGNDGGAASANGNANAVDLETRKQLAKLKADYDALLLRDKQRDEREKAREAEIARREEEGALSETLRRHVRPELVDAAVALHMRRGVVVRDNDGKVAIQVKREWGPEKLSVADGVAEWLKSEEGKTFLPQVNAGGSGDKSGGKAPNAGDKGVTMDLTRAFSIALASGGAGEE